MTERYSAALCGLGNISWKFATGPDDDPLSHAAVFQRDSRVKLVAGCAPSVPDREGFAGRFGLPVFEDLPEMLNEMRPDIVSICSPTEHHFEQIKACMVQKVPMVWVEKPPAQNSDELNELIALNKVCGNRSTVMVNYQRRYTGCYVQLKRLFDDESFGKPVRISINYSRGLSVNGVHFLDLIFFLLGEDVQYELSWVSTGRSKRSPSFVMTCANGVEVVVQGDDLEFHNNDISVTFERGRLSILYGGLESRTERCVENELFLGFYRLVEVPESVLAPAGSTGAFKVALDDLIHAHELGEEPAANLSSSLCSQILVDRCFSGDVG